MSTIMIAKAAPAGQMDILELIKRRRAFVENPENVSRKHLRPAAIFQFEPMANTALFNYDINRFFDDAEFYVRQTLKQDEWRWRTFPDDELHHTLSLPVWLGHYPEYTFVGLDVRYRPDGVPVIQTDHPISRDPDLRYLKPVDFKTSGWMPRILKWYESVRNLVGNEMEVQFNMTWWRGCLDLAMQLRGYEQLVVDMSERPQFVHDLMKYLTEQRCRWYEGYYEHFDLEPGPVGIADDWINAPFINQRMFEEFVLPRYFDIERFHGGILSIHSCGNQVPFQQDLLKIRSLEYLEVSPWSDLKETLANVPHDKTLVISVHPNDVLCSTEEKMEKQFRRFVDLCAERQYTVYTSGLSPVSSDHEKFVESIQQWTHIGHRALEEARATNGNGSEI